MKINILFKFLFLFILVFSALKADDGAIENDGMKLTNKKIKNYKKPPTLDESYNADNNYDKSAQRISEYTITDIENKDFGYIDIPNLKVGISGIVVNKKNAPIVIAVASVVESDDKRSKLQLKKYTDLKQDAIPTSNLKVSKGDKVILKYLYEASMVIAPNVDSFHALRNTLRDYNFLHPDMFSAFLKIEEAPIPTKELIQQFAIEQNLGSLVIVVKNKAYLIDSRTFKIVDTFDIIYDNEKEMIPFYTRVEKIETGTFDFGSDSIGKYTKYYKELLDI